MKEDRVTLLYAARQRIVAMKELGLDCAPFEELYDLAREQEEELVTLRWNVDTSLLKNAGIK